eukprot:2298922-Pyramimonas_sp.AAC.1
MLPPWAAADHMLLARGQRLAQIHRLRSRSPRAPRGEDEPPFRKPPLSEHGPGPKPTDLLCRIVRKATCMLVASLVISLPSAIIEGATTDITNAVEYLSVITFRSW